MVFSLLGVFLNRDIPKRMLDADRLLTWKSGISKLGIKKPCALWGRV